MYRLYVSIQGLAIKPYEEGAIIHDFYIASKLQMTTDEFKKIMMEDFNAVYPIEKININGNQIVNRRAIVFSSRSSAERALEWIESQLILEKLRG